MLPIPPEALEVAETDSGVVALKEAAERSLLGSLSPKDKPGEPDGGQPAARVGSEASPAGTTTDAAKPGDQPAAAKPPPPEELSFAPENYRKVLETAPEDFRKWVKDLNAGSMKDADYRKKTTAVAEARRAAEKFASENRQYLDFAQNVIGDEEAMRLLRELQDRRDGKATASTQAKTAFSFSTATDEEIEAHLRERDERIRAEAVAALDKRTAAERAADEAKANEMHAMAVAAKETFVDSGEYTAAQVDEVYDKLVRRGVRFTPDNVIENLRDFLPEKKVDAVNPVAAEGNGKASATASAVTRNAASGVTPALDVPRFVREKRRPNGSAEEIEEARWIAAQLRARRGVPGKRTP